MLDISLHELLAARHYRPSCRLIQSYDLPPITTQPYFCPNQLLARSADFAKLRLLSHILRFATHRHRKNFLPTTMFGSIALTLFLTATSVVAAVNTEAPVALVLPDGTGICGSKANEFKEILTEATFATEQSQQLSNLRQRQLHSPPMCKCVSLAPMLVHETERFTHFHSLPGCHYWCELYLLDNPPPCHHAYPICFPYRRQLATETGDESKVSMAAPVVEQLDSNHFAIGHPGSDPMDLASCKQAVSTLQASQDNAECEALGFDPEAIFYCL